MIELPECYVLAEQLNRMVLGKTIQNVQAGHTPHGFAWYSGTTDDYQARLSGRKITGASAGSVHTCGGNVEIVAEDALLVISTPIRYYAAGEKLPAKHQLLVEFDDFTALTCTVQMWGAMFCYPLDDIRLPGGFTVNKAPSPLSDAFDEAYFNSLLGDKQKKLSAKAFLATEQRVPGLGNGVLQDILFNAGIHPKRKMDTLGEGELRALFLSVKSTLLEMAACGGRDTERDLYGCLGGYRTKLSKNTVGTACRACGSKIKKEAYLGGAIYYCEGCQH